MNFTAKQLEEALNELESLDDDFPDYPLTNILSYRKWQDKDNFPLTFKKVGEDLDVVVWCEDYFGGEEGGDHGMYIILKAGRYNDYRYFRKDGEYNSWDDSFWDGAFYEVEQKEKVVKVWEMKSDGKKSGQTRNT